MSGRKWKRSAVFVLLAAFSACGKGTVGTATPSNPNVLTDQQIAAVMAKKIFFGHQSVGNNIVQGIRDLEKVDPRLKLNITKSPDPQSVVGPAFVEFEIGQNGNPQSKIDSFAAILDKGMGAQGGIAMFKFCYVDIDASTDVPAMFAGYRDAMSTLKERYPSLKIVHVTAPLTTVEPAAKAWIKSLLGKATLRAANVKRNQFNNLMRQTYAGRATLFDLAAIESTRSDGSRSYFTRGSENVYTLAPEYTVDGGHLNEAGRRAVAAQLLLALARL